MSVAVLDCVFAFSECVPQFDRLVTGCRDDLTVVDRECDGKDVFGVANEAACGGSGVEIPETEFSVP